ncbi:hypothetical protein A4H97_25030 [Niastella yeongjuensis]|uniref:DUF4294 domain-containing protein n=1 Tax=Niastella yeongjuensis TaxID=354355 RepID=A0A1V9F2K1_9BACT|nr:DUF4294 domain-containing protein [Niastella yeongjuensis]OQP52590.1 hypothetical protein A4H97_25030 [Niastella yeongjuensis]SEP34007.1 protein of unknown function [Niastella yeongjuensis]
MTEKRKIFRILFAVLAIVAVSINPAHAQTAPDTIPLPLLGPNDTIPVPAQIVENEYVPAQTLGWVWVQVPYPKHLLKRRQEWTRLRNAVYVCYPYARRAGAIMNDINAHISQMPDKDKKTYIKSREKELKKQFAEPLSELSIYQGKVLMKLINRQTGNNCYEIIKEYKGGFTARTWQTVAFLFGSNLKQPYDAQGDEREIESIVQEVERMHRM